VFVWDSYRRLIQAYAEIIDGGPSAPFAAVLEQAPRFLDVPTVSELDVAALREVTHKFHDIYRSSTGHLFSQDPMEQLHRAVEAVLRSWNAARAVEYRRLEGLTDLRGTAVTVQAMVFGNLGATSGAGVGFTRDPATGRNQLYVDFLLDAQGEDVVAGRHLVTNGESVIATVPGLCHELQTTRRALEGLARDAQDFEFTVEESRLWLLQTRNAKRTPWAALQIACDLVDEGLIDPPTALERLKAYDLNTITRARLLDANAIDAATRAIPASTGITAGRVALSATTARHYAEQGDAVVLVRHEASTEDIAALTHCRGLLTATGARTSHAAVVARHLGIVCVVGCRDLTIDPVKAQLRINDSFFDEGAMITVDGDTGDIYERALELKEERPVDLIARVRTWQTTPNLAP
jgi:pyruvate, orthophosphate dikinase